jgi:anti-sigma-K factor RskA
MSPRRHHQDPDVQAHTLIGPYVLDAVTDAERTVVERHLKLCPTCTEEVAELRATAARLADPVAVEPPPGLRERVLAQARQTRQQPPTPHPVGARRIGTARWRQWGVAAAAAVVLLVLAVLITYSSQQGRVDQARHRAEAAGIQQDQINTIMTAPDAALVPATLPDGAHARLLLSRKRNVGVVTLNGLPPLPGGHTYQLWLVREGAPHNAGVLQAGSRSANQLLTGVRAATAFAISTEPAGGSAQPTHIWASVPMHR